MPTSASVTGRSSSISRSKLRLARPRPVPPWQVVLTAHERFTTRSTFAYVGSIGPVSSSPLHPPQPNIDTTAASHAVRMRVAYSTGSGRGGLNEERGGVDG